VRAPATRRRGAAKAAVLFVYVSSLAALASWPLVASANHIKAQFPSMYGGTLWMSRREGYSGLQYITSSRCPAIENTAFSTIHNSTTGFQYMARWTNGIRMSQQRCDNVWTYLMDIRITYKDQSYFDQGGGYYIGGRNVDVQASSDYCTYWYTSYPCGSRPNVQINEDKFFSHSSTYEVNELMHETGHALGLAHHCTGPSIMDNGASDCYGGWFGGNPGYFATDRAGIDNVYP
jgi:hypothetical protein